MKSCLRSFMVLYCLCYFNIYCNNFADQGKNCRNRNRMIGTDKSDLYKLVDVLEGHQIMLECHYCNENDDKAPKVWYCQDHLLKHGVQEVELGMGSDLTGNRVYVTPDHTLVIQNISAHDTGVYYCHGVFGQEKQYKYNYMVDPILNTTVNPIVGNLTQWKIYHDTLFLPLNAKLHSSAFPQYGSLRKKYMIELQVLTEWESWGPCVTCNRPQGERRRVGKCRLKAKDLRKNGTVPEDVTLHGNDSLKLELLNAMSELSCSSELLARMFPTISEVSKTIPEFVQAENCVGACTPGRQIHMEKGKKIVYRKQFYQLHQGSHLTIICPEAKLETVVTWQKNGKMISPDLQQHQTEGPRVSVDTFGSLHLKRVTTKEGGNYTCFIDDKKMQEIRVLVHSEMQFVTDESVRHMAYLGLIFIICFVCYCGGLVVACKKRHQFVQIK